MKYDVVSADGHVDLRLKDQDRGGVSAAVRAKITRDNAMKPYRIGN